MNSPKKLPDYQYLKSKLSYCETTGVFRWLSSGKPAGYKDVRGYISIRINGSLYYAHRIAWLFYYGEYPLIFIDHINGNKSDNRILNLRLATKSQNEGNCGARANNKLGVRGVFKNKHGMFCAQICIKGKRIHLGIFSDIDSASNAYKAAAKNHFGDYSYDKPI